LYAACRSAAASAGPAPSASASARPDSTQEGAAQEWERLKRQNADLLGALSVATERVDLGDKGIFYRIQAGPLADGAEADRICSALRQRNVGCLLVKP